MGKLNNCFPALSKQMIYMNTNNNTQPGHFEPLPTEQMPKTPEPASPGYSFDDQQFNYTREWLFLLPTIILYD